MTALHVNHGSGAREVEEQKIDARGRLLGGQALGGHDAVWVQGGLGGHRMRLGGVGIVGRVGLREELAAYCRVYGVGAMRNS